jgi:RimJ/RimL family protein N-acetyltransferase
MYSLVTYLDLKRSQNNVLDDIKVLTEDRVFDPLSACLAFCLVEKIREYPFRSKTLLENLGRYHDDDARIFSPKKEYRSLSKSQAICLYLSYSIENYPTAQMQELLKNTRVVFARTHLIVLLRNFRLMSTEDQRKISGDWTEQEKVKILYEIPILRYDDVFFYYPLQGVKTIKGDVGKIREYVWGADRNGIELQKDAKIIVQAPPIDEYRKFHREEKYFCTIFSIDELIDIISSRIEKDSHGIIALPDTRFQIGARLIKYFRGWTFMASHPASYCDYREIRAFSTGEYKTRTTNYVPATLRNTLAIEALKRTEMNYLFDFLAKQGFPDRLVPLQRSQEAIREPNKTYATVKFEGGDVIFTEEEDENTWVVEDYFEEYPEDIYRVIMIVGTWDILFYPKLINDNDQIEEKISTNLWEFLDVVGRFYRGVARANPMNTYGYLTYRLDFIEQDERLRLYQVEAISEPFTAGSPLFKEYYDWVAIKCIVPLCSPESTRLVPMEQVVLPKTISQFKEVVTDPEMMRYIGNGSTWSSEDIDKFFNQQYKDASQSDTNRDYFDWLLVDEYDNMLAYLSIRKYRRDEKQIRVIARVQGKGYGKRAVFLAHNQYYLRTNSRFLYARVDPSNIASLRLFDSMYPAWMRNETNTSDVEFICSPNLDVLPSPPEEEER